MNTEKLADDIEMDIAKAVIITEIRRRGTATAYELKRAVEKALISAQWGFVNGRLEELVRKKYIAVTESRQNGIEEAVVEGWRTYKLTKKGRAFANSKTMRNILDILN